MISIIKENNGLVISGKELSRFFNSDGYLNVPLNSIILVTQTKSDIVMFKSASDYVTLFQTRWDNLTIEGELVTKENVVDKFNAIANAPQGSKINAGTNITLQEESDGSITISATGELGGTVAWQDVTDKPSTFTPSAHNHVVADITDLQGKLDAKQDKLVSGTNIKTINGQEILGSGDIVIEGGTGDVTKQYVDEQLALKVDKTVYEADKATFALKTEIPSIEGLASKEELQNGLEGKQDKGDYALKTELPDISGLATKAEVDETYAKKTEIPDISNLATKEELEAKADASALASKQDTLVSGTNIKTVNGNSLLGEGNIEIQGGGSGIADAPSDGKKYVRQNANWVEETTVDTSNFATKAEIADMLTKTEASSTYQPIGDYLTEIPSEYVTDEELNAKGYKKIEYLTQSQYDELVEKEEGVMYVITDAPEVVIPDTSTFATKEEIADMLTKTEAASTYQQKGEYATTAQLSGKQDTLVSGESIKTINGQTLLGSGDISIQGGNTEPKVWSTLNNEDFYNNAKVGDFISLSVPLTNLIIQDIRNGNGDQGTSGRNKTYTCSYYIDSYTIGNEKVSAYQFIVLESDYSVTTVEIKLATQNDLSTKQNTLVSGESIKTINGQDILGEGNIEIQGGTGDVTKQYVDEQLTLKADKTAIADMLTKTEASTTYALESALQAALDRIAALESQVGNISTQLDNINGEIV